MLFRQIPVGPMMNLSYLIVCDKTHEAALVDPAWEPDTLRGALKEAKADLRYLLCTHGHDDHVNLVPDLLNQFPAVRAVCHERERIPAPKNRTHAVSDGSQISIGQISVQCLHTPGHTPGSIAYIVGETHAFFGDTIFCGEGCGRVDFYRDGPKDMAASLQRIRQLPDSLIVCSGHKYGAYDTTTMEFEKKHNRALQCRTLEEFLDFKG